MATIEELSKKYRQLEDECDRLETQCASSGLTYEEMIDKLRPYKIEMWELDKEIRLIREPKIDYASRDYGKRLTLEEFIEKVNSGVLTDSDGFGKYAANKAVSDITIFPSDIKSDKYRRDFTHVMWMGR